MTKQPLEAISHSEASQAAASPTSDSDISPPSAVGAAADKSLGDAAACLSQAIENKKDNCVEKESAPEDFDRQTALSRRDGLAGSELQQNNRLASIDMPAVRPRLTDVANDWQALSLFLERFSDSPCTLRNYRKEAYRLLLWLESQGKQLVEMRYEDALAYRNFLANPQPAAKWLGCRHRMQKADGSINPKWKPFATPLSQASVRTALRGLNAWLVFLVDVGYLPGNPLGLLPRGRTKESAIDRQSRQHRVLTESHWQAIYQVLEPKSEDRPKQLKQKARWRWLISLFYLTGLRVSEVIGHHMGDIRLSKSGWQMHVVGKGNKPAWIAINSDLQNALVEYRAFLSSISPQLRLSPMPFAGEMTALALSLDGNRPLDSERAVAGVMKKLFQLAADQLRQQSSDQAWQAEQLASASCHWLRHSFTTDLLDAGVPLQDAAVAARHSDVRTTMLYDHSQDEQRHQQLNRLKMPNK
ncbi:tyrosine-type recombinase/integrase [Pelagibaculum spongiae]|uniref:Integrase n=1 Tax=Pelagibaculum spongiae TaxID=2080658 RepID=A0A2V1GXK9_9GAMM|nr:site-specific integrase [Pelagibaculum spongiae]PVZ69004.1 integrase [Pelagibaculum spongiae]